MSGRDERPSGSLVVVATPIGNLEDLSPRARRALEECDGIAAEDTRRTGRLLERLGLPKKRLFAYFAPREREKARAIVRELAEGRTIVLVTDGGTPGVSDPGAVLVRAARAAGATVAGVPGPCAAVLALSVSSLGGERFVFEGFLPARAAARRRRLAELASDSRALVIHEAPHRLAASLADLVAVLGGDRHATLVREATKIHEEAVEDTLAGLATRYAEGARGEVTLVVEGREEETDRVEVDVDALLGLALASGLSPDRAAREVAALAGLPRNPLVTRARRLAAGS